MNQHLDLFAALAAPFEHDEVRVRPQEGRQLQYITARTVMNRLDDVLGPSNWWDEYVPLEHSVICRLTIRLPDGSTLTKSDAGGYAGMPDSGDDDKSGFSDSFKRAAVKFGIGRYLYRDGIPRFIKERLHEHTALSEPSRHPASSPQASQPTPSTRGPVARGGHATPQSGKALFAWIKQQDEQHGFDLLRKISDWAKGPAFPARMIQWNADQVQQAYRQACSMIPPLAAEVSLPESSERGADAGDDSRHDRASAKSTEADRAESSARPASGSDRGAGHEPAQSRPSRNR
jgi:hypothetical protein